MRIVLADALSGQHDVRAERLSHIYAQQLPSSSHHSGNIFYWLRSSILLACRSAPGVMGLYAINRHVDGM